MPYKPALMPALQLSNALYWALTENTIMCARMNENDILRIMMGIVIK
jgi:hypothetical protein